MEIAIIGLNMRIPGVNTLEELNNLLSTNSTSISEIPKNRWDKNWYEHIDELEMDNPINVGGFIDKIDCFDNKFFNISNEEASALDPQERLFLEIVWGAFEDAGYGNIRNSEQRNISLYVGSMWNDYTILSNEIGFLEKKYCGPGSQSWSIANRVSHYMGFSGQSLSVNTACSSTSYSIHLACQDLERSDSYMSVAGGVNLIIHPSRYISLYKESLLSRESEKRCFAPGGEGFIPSEGVGAIVLKRLSDAEKDGDYIYATILGSASKHNGKSMFYKTPNPSAQAATIKQAIKKAGIKVDEISHIELSAYGSETVDGAELLGLKQVFNHKDMSCSLGSIKPNIGHAEAASSISQLAKVVLQLKYGKIFPSRFHSEPPEELMEKDHSFVLNHQLVEWGPMLKSDSVYRRIAGINSFGAGGTNVHIIVSEYRKRRSSIDKVDKNEFFLIPFSAKTRVALRESIIKYRNYINDNEMLSLRNISYTLIEGREHFEKRFVFIVQSLDELKDGMEYFLKNKITDNCFSPNKATELSKIAYKWLNGGSVSWEILGKDVIPEKVPLPTYPFARDSFWLGNRDNKNNELLKDSNLEKISFEDDLNHLYQMIGNQIGLSVKKIKEINEIRNLNISSMDITALNSQIENIYGPIPKTLFFRYKTIDDLASFLSKQKHNSKQSNASNVTQNEVPLYNTKSANVSNSEIAIIGVSGKYPSADDLNQFWDNLKKGKDCITKVPSDRWGQHSWWYNSENEEGNYLMHGGFLNDVTKFDPLFFEISPKEAELMDPQERLFLEVAWKTVEDAGYTSERLQQNGISPVGVFVGAMWTDYQLWGLEEVNKKNMVSASSTLWSIPNRVSHCLNFNGPSIAVDSACSSSLSAIHLACESIKTKKCSVALAGGVSLSLHPLKYLYLSKRKMASQLGRCFSYGQKGDGFVPGEGVGAVLLKDKSQAIADGDHIYATITASESIHGGKSNGFLVPDPKAQSRLILNSLNQAGVDARSLSYIEGHGTGTALGDPIEIEGLSEAIGKFTKDKQFCAIGSVKSNIGHCEPASGIAGLTKVLLQLKNKKIVPSLHSSSLNSNIDFENTPFFVNQKLQDWKCPNGEGSPRIAGISSFGAGGSNTHLIIKEYIEKPYNISTISEKNVDPVIIILSAKNKERLWEVANNLLEFVQSEFNKKSYNPKMNIKNLSYTLQVGRKEMEERLGFIVSSVEELENKLNGYLNDHKNIEGLYIGHVKSSSANKSDEDMSKTINAWITKRKYSNILDLWITGYVIDWNNIYTGSKPKRINLPTYPFAKEHYWIPVSDKHSISQDLDKTQIIHPLLHKNSSDLSEQRYSTTFKGNEFFLADHVVNEEKILPGVVYLEMAKIAIENSTNSLRNNLSYISLKNVIWIQPFVVQNTSKEINIGLFVEKDNQIKYKIYSTPTDDNYDLIVYSEGVAELKELNKYDPIDLSSLKSEMNQGSLNPEYCYQYFKSIGLNYGSGHQGINKIYLGENQLLTKISLPQSLIETLQQYCLHPCLMDSVFQSSMFVNYQVNKKHKLSLPFSLGNIEILTHCSQTMYAWIRFNEDESTDKINKFNIDLVDQQGNICCKIKSFTTKYVENKVNPNTSETIGTLISYPVWKEKSVLTETTPVEYTKHLVIACEIDSISIHDIEKTIKGSSCKVLQSSKKILSERFTDYASQVFKLIKDLFDEKPTGKCLLQIVTPGENENQTLSGLVGLLNVAHQENPNFIGQVIEIGASRSKKEVIEIIEVNSLSPEDTLVRYSDKKRQLLFWDDLPLASIELYSHWKDNGVYLITGGMGGLGRIFAQEILKETNNARVILTGRSPLNNKIKTELKTFQSKGTLIEYRQIDISKQKNVKELIESIVKDYGCLQGIIHSAGILSDNFIIKKSVGEFHRVISPKITGTINLDEASKKLNLDFFVLFSSTAGVLGNLGQADYSTGNAFMDRYANYRNSLLETKKRYGKTLSINWPLWEEGGMRVDPESEKRLEENIGMVAMKSKAGINAFYRGLTSKESQVIVVEGDVNKIRAFLDRKLQVIEKNTELSKKDLSTLYKTDRSVFEENAVKYLKKLLSSTLKIKAHRIDPDEPLEKYGIDSIMSLDMTQKLENQFGDLSKTLFFEYQTISDLSHYFIQAHKEKLSELLNMTESVEIKPLKKNQVVVPEKQFQVKNTNQRHYISIQKDESNLKNTENSDIAIIGMSGRFPQAYDLEIYWENLSKGKNCITEIPENRWNWKDYYTEDRSLKGAHYSKWGGFIEGVDEFDPLFFNISPREAELMDPQERLFLEHSWKAVEDAGYVRSSIQNPVNSNGTSDVGVYAGVMYGEYQLFGAEESLRGNRIGFANSSANVANRVSYFMNFNGPSITVDTMCSSSLTAINMACQGLKSNRISMAIAGAVNITIHPNKYLLLSAGQFISTRGHCESFGEGGDGYIPGEGVGVTVLKRLEDAERDGDNIYGVIKGSAINHGGKTNGYSIPNPNAQQRVIEQAMTESCVDPRKVSYVEAHGTGTKLGDPIEITGLTKAFRNSTTDTEFCMIGSAKSNIGHCESAAGVAGIIKVLLQMKNGKIVPSLHSSKLNPNIDFKKTPFIVSQTLQNWKRPVVKGEEVPRLAGISAFGAGGSNAHILIEEYRNDNEHLTQKSNRESIFLVPLSAKTPERLREAVTNLSKFVKKAPEMSLKNLTYTLQVGREAMEERLGFSVTNIQELIQKLDSYLSNDDSENLFIGNVDDNRDTIALLMSDKEFDEMVNKWVKRNKHSKILELWVKGLSFDWNKLYYDKKPKRISLPTYPFARDRYWVPNNGITDDLRSYKKQYGPYHSEYKYIHPLLHKNISSFSSQQYSSSYTGEEFFLTDHLVNGKKVLPAVVYLEMAREAVLRATDTVLKNESIITLKNVVWVNPLHVSNSRKIIHTSLSQDEKGEINYRIYSNSDDKNASPVIYCKGNASLSITSALKNYDLDEFRSECNIRKLLPAQCYEMYKKSGINYGPGHQGISEIYIGNNQVLAKLTLPKTVSDTLNQYGLHPSIVDSALQASIGLFNFTDNGSTLVPFALEKIQILKHCRPEMWAIVKTNRNDTIQKFDIDLCNKNGQICIRMEGIAIRPLKSKEKKHTINEYQNSISNTDDQSIGTMMLSPIWDVIQIKDNSLSPSLKDQITIFGSDKHILNYIKKLYSKTEIFSIKHLNTVEEIKLMLETLSKIDHIIWVTPQITIQSITDETLIESQNKVVLPFFRTIKALLDLGYGSKDLNWTILTTQSQQIHKADSINPAHSTIQGLVGTMAKEYPKWKVRLVDLEMNVNQPLEKLFKLPYDSKGNLLVYRQQQWYRQSLVPVHGHPFEKTIYRNKGVYVVIGGSGGIGEVWTEYMIRHYKAQIIWIGRSPISNIQKKLEKLSSFGSTPFYLSADATNRTSMETAYKEIKKRFSNINGVIHSAIVLKDKSLRNMDEETFKTVLSSKVDVSVRISQVFQKESLDFVLFFSSMQSFTKNLGQSNYAAGCTFKDAFANQLSIEWKCPIKVINWGYWGSVGVVALKSYKDRLAQSGVGSIEPPEAMNAVDILMAGSIDQLAFLKTTKASVVDDFNYSKNSILTYKKEGTIYNSWLQNYHLPSTLQVLKRNSNDIKQSNKMNELLGRLLFVQLHSLGLFDKTNSEIDGFKENSPFNEMYNRWLDISVDFLSQANYIQYNGKSYHFNNSDIDDLKNVWQDWENFKNELGNDSALASKIKLVEITLRAMPDILTGKIKAIETIFPKSSMVLVENVYKNNPVSDYYNEVLAEIVINYIKEKLKNNSKSLFRILEIGAGTGGTSAKLFDKLEVYQEHIEEYRYTDISKAFLIHAEKQYGSKIPYLKCSLFDVEKTITDQKIQIDSYDMIVASNVLHATKNISLTLRNAKSALKKDGLVLLNEISRNDLFSHLTFGLLEGWWLYEDKELRIHGCPGLTSETWESVLIKEGFNQVVFPAYKAHAQGQQVVVAVSDGVNRLNNDINFKNDKTVSKQLTEIQIDYERDPKNQNTDQDKKIFKDIINYLKKIITDTLKTNPEEIDVEKSLDSYGLDSILVLELNNKLLDVVPDLPETLFFEYSNIKDLGKYFMESHGEAFSNLFKNNYASDKKSVEHLTVISEKNNNDNTTLKHKISTHLKSIVCDTLKIEPDNMNTDKSLDAYGLDSILILDLNNKLQKIVPDLSETLFFEYSSIKELENYFVKAYKEEFEAFFKLSKKDKKTAETHLNDRQYDDSIDSNSKDSLIIENKLQCSYELTNNIDISDLGIDDIIKLEQVELVPENNNNHRHQDTSLSDKSECLLIHENKLMQDAELKKLIESIDKKTPLMGYEQKIYPYFFISSDRTRYIRLFKDPTKNIIIPCLGMFDSIYQELLRYCEMSNLKLLIVAPYHKWIIKDQNLVPVGIEQDIEIKSFTLKGNKMRKLRYLVQKFEKSGDVKVQEYNSVSNVKFDDMKELMKKWSKNKKNIIQHSYTCMEDLLRGSIPMGYRAFLTYHNNKVCNVIVIEPGEEKGFYLMDQEFYDPQKAPLGHMEYSIVEIIRQLSKEDAKVFSLGITWYPFIFESSLKIDSEVWNWLHDLDEKQTLLSRIFQQGKTNYQFKKKFHATEQPVYAYLPKGEPFSLMLNYWPVFYQNSLTKESVYSKLDSIKQTNNNVEKNNLNIVQDKSQNRIKLLEKVYEIEKIDYRDNPLDLLTDSWFESKTDTVKQRTSYLQSEPHKNSTEVFQELFPFEHLIFTDKGRIAEELFYQSIPNKKKKILTAIPWTTTLMNQLKNGFEVIELPVDSALQANNLFMFKGEIDIPELKAHLKKDHNNIALVGLELLSNATGGHPVRMTHIKEIKRILKEYNVPFVIDASRIIRNSILIKQHEWGFKQKDIWKIARESMEYADHIVMSLTKDFAIPIGGLIATHDKKLAKKLLNTQKNNNQTITSDTYNIINQGLHENDFIIDLITKQFAFTARIKDMMIEEGIPIVTPVCGHAILVDNSKLITSDTTIKQKKELFLKELFMNTGIRAGIHQVGKQKCTLLDNCIRIAFPIGLKKEHEDKIFVKLQRFFSEYIYSYIVEDVQNV